MVVNGTMPSVQQMTLALSLDEIQINGLDKV